MPAPYSERLEKLMKSFTKLPGIGPKSAERIVLHLLKQDRAQVEELARLISEAKANTFFCGRCNNLSEKKICHICENQTRDQATICIVEEPKDVASIERTGSIFDDVLVRKAPSDARSSPNNISRTSTEKPCSFATVSTAFRVTPSSISSSGGEMSVLS